MAEQIQCFDLNSSVGEWFPFFRSEQKPDGTTVYEDPQEGVARIQLRIADSEVIESIQKQTRTKKVDHVVNPSSRKMERIEYFDQTPEQEKLERELIWDHAIMNWEDKAPFLNKDGSPIEKTVENKLKLMGRPMFARCVTRCLQMITGLRDEAKALATKN
jgi:hypothetical protein